MLTEDLTTEFKREYVDDIKKTVVAFANTLGGTIYIGVDDKGEAVGVQKVDETMLKVSNAIRDAIKPDVTLFTDCSVRQEGDAAIIVVKVQKGTDSPYYLSSKGIRPAGVYIRQGASSVPATEAAILKMIRETDGENYEQVRSLNQNLTFHETRKAFDEAALKFGREQMKTLHMINEDGMYSNLALLLSDQCVHTIKAAVFEGTQKAIFKDRYEFSGSLLKQLSDAYGFIDRYNRTRAEFSGLKRIDRRDYPEEAIRETLLNVIVHRDYTFSGSTLISIFDDRLEFVSLGGLVKGITEKDIQLGVSILRNPNLANVFYRLHLIEAYGTGIPKIIESYKTYERKPVLEISDNAFKVILYNINSRISEDEKNSQREISEREQQVLRLFENKESIVRKEVEQALAISQTAAVNLLKELTNKKILRKMGSGKTTHYQLY